MKLIRNSLLAIFAFGAILSVTQAAADDRDLLRSSSVKPYVMVLFDTSGSMNWSPPCSAADFNAIPKKCGFLCPGGDCFVPRNADDPASKFRQAREAVAQVIRDTSDVFWGFATYNGDQQAVFNKHWLYKVSATQPAAGLKGLGTSANWTEWPVRGAQEVFGAVDVTTTGTMANALFWDTRIGTTNCGTNGCRYNRPVTLPASSASAPNFDLERLRRLPKGDGTRPVVQYWVKDSSLSGTNGNNLFRIRYQLATGQTLGAATITALLDIDRCTRSDCSAFSNVVTDETVNFDLDGQFLMWDSGGTKPSGGNTDYFNYDDTTNGNTCSGWEPNTDNTSDKYSGYSFKFPNTSGASIPPPPRDYGDVTPLDWDQDNASVVRARLAPDGSATVAGESFAQAPYFADARAGADTFLRLSDPTEHPVVAAGSTPLGATLQSFRAWYTGSTTGQGTLSAGSWRNQAITQDRNWSCRKVYVLFITDGDETCSGDPCAQTAALNTYYDTKTYVVGFGLQAGSGNKLNCMAANGGTVNPILPQNKDALVDALNSILSQIREDTAAFASAAVPSVQAQVADKIYLTNFSPVTFEDPAAPVKVNTPTNGSAIWIGHIQAFLKPLPASIATGFVDDTPCAAGDLTACLAWDAGPGRPPVVTGTGMVSQAPSATEIGSGNRRIGTAIDERRIYYSCSSSNGSTCDGGGPDTVPQARKLFLPPVAADRVDFFNGMGIANTGSGDATALAKATGVINFMLQKKHTEINRDLAIPGHPNPEPVDYILGDIFHSNPVVLNNPSSLSLFSQDLGFKTGQSTDCRATTNVNTGYRCFFLRHRCRRRMLFVGSNDGQMHVVDAGIFAVPDPDNDNLLRCSTLDPARQFKELTSPIGFFNLGSGKEIFSFIPRQALPKMAQYASTGQQDWSVDGTPVPNDVFIDPVHDGTPLAADRQWRTVVVSGMREGGNEIFALDVTQPDVFDVAGYQVPQPLTSPSSTYQVSATAGYVNSCSSASSSCGPSDFPAVLWEFTDQIGGARIDEDSSGQPGYLHPDLAQTWSIPSYARIRVCDGANCDPASPTNNLVDKYVVIFGGGLEHSDPTIPYFSQGGNWLYMVDIETGKTLYKRQLDGSVPSAPAVADLNQDGYTDTVYVGTTTGYMYKVDMSTVPQLVTGNISYRSCAADPCSASVLTASVKRITDVNWSPFKIFDTISGGTRRQLYYPPSVVFVAQLGKYALGFGTGNRENLWEQSNNDGRFYMLVDTGFTRAMALAGTLPFNQSNYPAITPTSSAATYDFVLNPAGTQKAGWIMTLGNDERIISAAFTLSGITVFTGYTPSNGVINNLCSRGGTSRIFTVLTTNGDALINIDGDPARFVARDSFVTNPFVEHAQTQNTTGNANDPGTELSADQKEMFEKLKQLFPANCKFNNFRLDIKTIRADTKVMLIAPMPVCQIEKDWKEF